MIKLNRGQALSLWAMMAEMPTESQVRLIEQRGDGEIWAEVEADLGKQQYKLPPSGGHFRVDSTQEAPRPTSRDSLRYPASDVVSGDDSLEDGS